MLTDVCASQYTADFIFSGGMSGAGNKDFKIKGNQKRAAQKKSISLANETSKSEKPNGNTEKENTQAAKLLGRADPGYDANNPCDATFESNFPKPNAALGYIAVYGERVLLDYGKGSQLTWGQFRSKTTITSTQLPDATTRLPVINQRVCPGDRYPQACANWRSIANNHGWRQVVCPTEIVSFNSQRFAVSSYYAYRNTAWKTWIQKSVAAPYDGGVLKPVNCQADEWPPFDLTGSRGAFWTPYIYIRLLPGGENGGAANYRWSSVKFEQDCTHYLSLLDRQLTVPGGRLPIPVTTSTETLGTIVGVWTDTVWIRSHRSSTVTTVSIVIVYSCITFTDNIVTQDLNGFRSHACCSE